MGAKVKTTQVAPSDKIDDLLLKQAAKTQFFTSTANLSWRLAITIVVPLVGGVKLDEKFNSSPSWTLTGIFIAVAAGCAAVWATVKEVNQEQAETEARIKKGGSN
ncbi:MAG: AtpZ/AtpI family protein [Candidatus Saccharibacteria bacterium]|nr:AtpZ/AtpI family protein [Candidatus Saccharibacteria bacterium]